MHRPVTVPPALETQRGIGPEWGAWLDRLPKLVAALLAEWDLAPEGDDVWHGHASLVLPVRDASGEVAVLKVAFDGDDESLHEPLALQHWAGEGAVRLLRADPARRAMVLERLHREDLGGVWDVEACEIVGALYSRLHRPALPQLRTVTSYVAGWLEDLRASGPEVPLPRRLVEQALSLGADLVTEPASTGVLVHGDLHYANVLAADRAPWLAIDPKPMSGDPHYEPAPMLWNRWDEVLSQADVRATVRRRFHALVDAADLDEDRARDWVIVRAVITAHWTVEDAQRSGRALAPEDQEWVTRCLTVAKAVRD